MHVNPTAQTPNSVRSGIAVLLAERQDLLAGKRVGVLSNSSGVQQAPTADQLADLDVIVCDLQDVGCRFYTYAWTVINLIEIAVQHGVHVVITDRPNPIGGAAEGPGVEPNYRTLVGLYDVPIRHGLTLGELAQYIHYSTARNHGWYLTNLLQWYIAYRVARWHVAS